MLLIYSPLYLVPEVGDSKLYALDIAEGVLNGRSGRLHKRLVQEENLAVKVSASNSPNKYVSEDFQFKQNWNPMQTLRKQKRLFGKSLKN